MAHDFYDIECSSKRLPPIYDYHAEKLVSLEKALEPIESKIEDLPRYVKMAKKHCHYPSENGLTRDESAAVYIYTMEWNENSLYRVLNNALRSEQRHATKGWFPYLKLFDTALDKLPTFKGNVWRGVPVNIGKNFIKDQIITWWSFNSCSSSVDVIQSLLGKNTQSTLFLIETINGKRISCYGAYENEDEIILRMGMQLRVGSDRLKQSNSSYIVHLIEIDDDNDNKLITPITNEIHPAIKTSNNGASATSPFYYACRDNNISLVEDYLKTMSLEEINKIEPNGSTALHVAAYRGHEKIVGLLLEKGACHTTTNKYNNTPLDEAKTDQIKQLIRNRRHAARFVGDSIEWIVATDNADYQAHEYSKKLEAYGKDPHFYQLIIYIKQNYLEYDLASIYGIDKIKKYFDKATNKKDPVYLLIAYTADTDFYSQLNVHLAQLQLESLTDQANLSYAYYIGMITFHPKFETFSYIGTTFRGMMINNNDLKQYKIGSKILTKTFSSTSKQLNEALKFLGNKRDTNEQISTICVYEIRYKRTALDIAHISEFPYEQEVLVLPYSAFKIIDIKQNKLNSPAIEIKLKECEPW